MNMKQIVTAVLAITAVSAAMAGDANSADVWSKFDNAGVQPGKTRAEVLADLEIYRRSGLSELDNRDYSDFANVRRAEASARYEAMRASPEFAQLVKSFAEHGELLLSGKTRAPSDVR